MTSTAAPWRVRVASAALVADPRAGPWLVAAMRATSCVAADGWPQCYGLRAADPAAPVKQG